MPFYQVEPWSEDESLAVVAKASQQVRQCSIRRTSINVILIVRHGGSHKRQTSMEDISHENA